MNVMLVIVLVLLVLWTIGLATSCGRRGRIHILLAVAVVLFVSWAAVEVVRRG